jgi:hypothetical protein
MSIDRRDLLRRLGVLGSVGGVVAGTASTAAAAGDSQPTITLFPDQTVRLPDGTVMSVGGSLTAGIQETIDLGMSLKADIHIVGGGDVRPGFPGGAVVYRILRPIILPPMQGKRITTGAVTWAFGFNGDPGVFATRSGLIFDTCMLVNFDFNGQIVYFGGKIAVEFSPRHPAPYDYWMTAVVDSRFHFMAVVCYNPSAACVWLTPNAPSNPAIGSITNSSFDFDEINGGAWGIHAQTPWAPTRTIARNFFSCPHVHSQTNTSVRVGDLHMESSNRSIRQNSWRIIAEPNGAARGVETNGSNDLWDLCVPAVFGPPSYGLILGQHARDNLFLIKDLQGSLHDASNGRNRFV